MGELHTRRVQRLDPKPENEMLALNTRVWGGGQLLLSDKAWEVLQEIVDIHYMGFAEYELGALPTCLSSMVENREGYTTWDFTIKAKDIKLSLWRKYVINKVRRKELDEAKAAGTKAKRMSKKHRRELEAQIGITPPTDHEIFVISNGVARDDVKALIKAVGERTILPKGNSGFDLDPDQEWSWKGHRGIGWLDLDNELVWFIDRDVRDAFATMLGVTMEEDDG